MITPDTSVVLPLLAPWHELHEAARRALADGEPARALMAHVAVECISALGRLPRGHRVAPDAVLQGLECSAILVTADRRTLPTYEALGLEVTFVA